MIIGLEFVTLVKDKVFCRQICKILANIMHGESEANTPMVDFEFVQERVVLVTRISLRSVQRVQIEMQQIEDGEDYDLPIVIR